MIKALAMVMMVAAMAGAFYVLRALGPLFATGVIVGSLIVHIGYRAANGHWIEF